MIFQALFVLFLSCGYTFAKKDSAPKPELPNAKKPTLYVSIQKSDKGELLFDPKSCQFKMLKNDLHFSIMDGNFLIEFPNGQTAIGDIDNSDKDKRPACFHSLTKPIIPGLSVIANHTSLGILPGTVPGSPQDHNNGLINCKRRDGSAISDEIRYYPNKTSRDEAMVVTIHKGNGITFFKNGKPIGNNITRKDLKFDEKYRSKCEEKAASPEKDGKPSEKHQNT